MKRKIALVTTRTLALYGFAGWVYIALVALVHPWTLGLQLTHFMSLPHEDTFGEASFVVSLVAFFVHNLLRATEPAEPARPGEPGGQSARCEPASAGAKSMVGAGSPLR